MARPGIGSSLRHKYFRDYYIAQAISMGGTWMQSTALSFLIWRTTKSEFLLGLITFLNQIPNLVLAPVGGVFADRHSRRRVVVVTQVCAMIQALGLALAVYLGYVHYAVIGGFAFLLGIIVSFDIPARQSFIIELVGIEDLQNAIALNSMLFNGARFIAPPIAGLLLLRFNESAFFLVNGLSYIYVIWVLWRMRPPERDLPVRSGNVLQNFGEAVRFVFPHSALRDAILIIALISLVGIPHVVLLPAVAGEALGWEDARGFALLLASSGLGSLIGGIFMARGTVGGRSPRVVPVAALAFGASLLVFSFMDSLAACCILLLPAGATMMMQTVGVNSFLQTHVPDRFRGRVMSFYSMAFLGILPLGSLFMGLLADQIGSMMTIRIGAVAVVVGGATLLARVPRARGSIDDLHALAAAEAASGGK